MRENTDQNNFLYGHFKRSASCVLIFGESSKNIGLILVLDISLLQQRFSIHRLLVTGL